MPGLEHDITAPHPLGAREARIAHALRRVVRNAARPAHPSRRV